jgi:hypothetical protein
MKIVARFGKSIYKGDEQMQIRKIWFFIFLTGWLLTGCGGEEEPAGQTPAEPIELTLMTHDSFAISESVLAQFESEHNVRLVLGAIAAAKSLEAERVLRTAFEHGEVQKRYLALVEGEHPLDIGESEVIDRPIAPDERKSGRMIVHPSGKPSQTRISVVERFAGYTLMAAEPLTGRTHQIRVHLSDAGFPLVIDHVYGRRNELKLSELKAGYRGKRGAVERPLMDRLTLHAAVLTLPPVPDSTPIDGEPLIPGSPGARVESPLPADLGRVLKQLRKVRPFKTRPR